jgi:hypothetical protein
MRLCGIGNVLSRENYVITRTLRTRKRHPYTQSLASRVITDAIDVAGYCSRRVFLHGDAFTCKRSRKIE